MGTNMRHGRAWAAAGLVAVSLVAGATWISAGQAQTRPDTAAPAPAPASRPAIAAFVARPRGAVDWQAAVGGLRQSANVGESLAANLNREQVDKTAVPILLPRDPKLTAGARIYSFGDYYTITADTLGGGVSLSGTTTTVPSGKPLKVESGPEMLTVQRTVDGQLASFVRFGVLYTVEIRCDSAGDPRCVDDNYLLGLVGKTTAVVMGKAARQAAGLGG
ncbi:hypothetical protein OVA11_14980 [Caulobacter sp. SL161]|uniref:hypothetical protein n=1 Tax=Caulobacter sp. SL161 TaxID=2995156 RepID=UPI0022756582|nr:hypothetical protein [Caulobacter sp. SL161]MCY1648319.1 hypothetical protein [Caulobacter sp. SL161]